MDQLDNIRTELTNANESLRGNMPKTMWSKYYLKDRRQFLIAQKERDDTEKAVHYLQEKVCNEGSIYEQAHQKGGAQGARAPTVFWKKRL